MNQGQEGANVRGKLRYLQQRNGHYRYIRSIPVRLRQIAGKQQWIKVLGTADREAAISAVPRCDAAFNADMLRLKAILERAPQRPSEADVQAGLARWEVGFFDRSHYGGMVKVGRQSRIRATASLVELAAAHGLTGASITIAPSTEVILLRAPKVDRNRPGRLVQYQDTDETIGLRSTLRRINAVLAATRIELSDVGQVQSDAAAQEPPDGEPLPIDRSSHRLYRVFNDGSFDRGGRFYGWWQGLKKEDRRRLIIDGEPVIELDFAGMHPRLCYALDGHPLAPEVDPYAIPGLEGAALRDLVKRGFNQLLNGTENTAKAPPGCAGKLPQGMRWHQLLARIEDHHRPIGHWLRCRRGLELQAIDAGIAEQVLSFLAYKGIPCLPVHDSFIVAQHHEDRLGETMMLAWHGQIRKHNGKPGVPPIKGWSSLDIARRVTLRVAS